MRPAAAFFLLLAASAAHAEGTLPPVIADTYDTATAPYDGPGTAITGIAGDALRNLDAAAVADFAAKTGGDFVASELDAIQFFAEHPPQAPQQAQALADAAMSQAADAQAQADEAVLFVQDAAGGMDPAAAAGDALAFDYLGFATATADTVSGQPLPASPVGPLPPVPSDVPGVPDTQPAQDAGGAAAATVAAQAAQTGADAQATAAAVVAAGTREGWVNEYYDEAVRGVLNDARDGYALGAATANAAIKTYNATAQTVNSTLAPPVAAATREGWVNEAYAEAAGPPYAEAAAQVNAVYAPARAQFYYFYDAAASGAQR